MTFSVLISVYANENPVYLNKSLESIWELQTLKPNEIVLVEDGKLSVELYEVLDAWQAKIGTIFKRIPLPENGGLTRALNIGIVNCTSDYIARMDSDDIALEGRFQLQCDYLVNNPDIDILGTWAIDIDAEGSKKSIRKVPLNNADIVKYIWTCPIIHPTVIYKKESITKVGMYNANLRRRQDYELWFRCVSQGLKFANLHEPLLLYRFTEDWFKKNNLKVIWGQVKMGWTGCKLVNATPMAYLGVFFPLIKIALPTKLGMLLTSLSRKFDPRNRGQ